MARCGSSSVTAAFAVSFEQRFLDAPNCGSEPITNQAQRPGNSPGKAGFYAMTFTFGFKARDFEVFDLSMELTDGFFR